MKDEKGEFKMKEILTRAKVEICIMKENLKEKVKQKLTEERGDVSQKVLWIALGLIIAVAVFYPGLENFAGDIIDSLNTWYTTTMKSKIFPTTL